MAKSKKRADASDADDRPNTFKQFGHQHGTKANEGIVMYPRARLTGNVGDHVSYADQETPT